MGQSHTFGRVQFCVISFMPFGRLVHPRYVGFVVDEIGK